MLARALGPCKHQPGGRTSLSPFARSMRDQPLEAQFSGAIVTQQGPKDQPAHASIGPCVRVKTGEVGP
jgi:hypothetical protein